MILLSKIMQKNDIFALIRHNAMTAGSILDMMAIHGGHLGRMTFVS
jgi:hypothetical protein